MAFEEVCPERIDLIHKNYRKLCNLLIDIDEWGQVAVIHMLTRYARTQFVDPNKEVLLNGVLNRVKNLSDVMVPYLPVYNVRPCIIHTPILDCTLKKKKEAENRGSGYAKLA